MIFYRYWTDGDDSDAGEVKDGISEDLSEDSQESQGYLMRSQESRGYPRDVEDRFADFAQSSQASDDQFISSFYSSTARKTSDFQTARSQRDSLNSEEGLWDSKMKLDQKQ